jgi:hypothetical protein
MRSGISAKASPVLKEPCVNFVCDRNLFQLVSSFIDQYMQSMTCVHSPTDRQDKIGPSRSARVFLHFHERPSIEGRFLWPTLV